jgi:hypothetical protein
MEHKMCVLIFSTTFVWNISHCKTEWAKYGRKCILVFISSTYCSCKILMKFEFSWQIFEKCWNIIFHENLSSGSQVVPCSWGAGRQTDMREVIASLCNFVNTPKMIGFELNKIFLLQIHNSLLLCYRSGYSNGKAFLHW